MYYKGIVVEIKEKYALVMDSSGNINKIKLKHKLNVGDAIFFSDEDIIKDSKLLKFKKKTFILPIVTAALIFFAVLMNLPSKNINPILSPYALVTLDINPSIGIEVDENETVLNVKGLNNDGKNMDLNNFKGKSFDEVIKSLKTSIESNKKIKNKDSIILGFAFLGNNHNKAFEDNIKNIVKDNFKGFKIVYINSNKEDTKKAENKGLSIGRYKISEELGDELEDKIENMSVDDLIKLLNKKGTPTYLNEEMKDEIEDRYEDKYENSKSNKKDLEDNKESNDNDDSKHIEKSDTDSDSLEKSKDKDDDKEKLEDKKSSSKDTDKDDLEDIKTTNKEDSDDD